MEFHHDEDPYYYNEHTQESVWELPADCIEIMPDETMTENNGRTEYPEDEYHHHPVEITRVNEDTDYSSAENWDSSVEAENQATKTAGESNDMDIMMLALGSGGETTADEEVWLTEVISLPKKMPWFLLKPTETR